jgi:hypothetical protein
VALLGVGLVIAATLALLTIAEHRLESVLFEVASAFGTWGLSAGAQAADLLKDLTERIHATFVHAGIDVTTTPLFSGVRGAQLAGRATLITCGPLTARHGQSHPFTDVITDLENALDLQHHRPGTLPRAARCRIPPRPGLLRRRRQMRLRRGPLHE